MFTDGTKAYDIIESAQILGFTPNTLRKYLADGLIHGDKIKHEKDRPKVYITMDEIKRFISARCKE